MTRYFAEPGLRAIGRYTKLPAFGDLAAGEQTGNPSLIGRASAMDGLSASMLLDLDARFGVNLSGSDVTAWEDAAPAAANDFIEGVSRPAYSASSANWGGLPAITYTAASVDMLNSVDAASAWTFLHNGSGASVALVFRFTGVAIGRLFSTANALTNVGMLIQCTADGLVEFRIRNGASSYQFVGAQGFPIGSRCTVVYAYKSGELAGYLNGTGDIFDNSAFTPSAAAPTATARIGHGTSGTNPFDGDIVAVHVWTRYFSAADAARYHQWAQRNWNL